jgi:hypothetical protein
MAQFGELFGGAKLRKETEEDAGTGERFGYGPLDLEVGVIPVSPRPRSAEQPDEEE